MRNAIIVAVFLLAACQSTTTPLSSTPPDESLMSTPGRQLKTHSRDKDAWIHPN